MHINDARPETPIDELPDTLRYLPGEGGAIDLRLFLSSLKRLGYTGPVQVEPFSETLRAMSDNQKIAAVVASSYEAFWPVD